MFQLEAERPERLIGKSEMPGEASFFSAGAEYEDLTISQEPSLAKMDIVPPKSVTAMAVNPLDEKTRPVLTVEVEPEMQGTSLSASSTGLPGNVREEDEIEEPYTPQVLKEVGETEDFLSVAEVHKEEGELQADGDSRQEEKDLSEHVELSSTSVGLTDVQKDTARLVREKLDEASPKLIIIEGFGGVGKTTVISKILPDIAAKGGRTVEPYEFQADHSLKKLQSHRGFLVTTLNPRELEVIQDIVKKKLPELEVVTHVLKGMNLGEIISFMEKQLGNQRKKLPIEQLAPYSLGIPLLARYILLNPDLTQTIATRLSANFLASNIIGYRDPKVLQAAVEKYLKVVPPADVFDIIPEIDLSLSSREHIYDGLPRVLNNQDELRNKGVFEESPYFIAPQSEEVYSRMLKGASRRNSIDIFVPNLGGKDLGRIQQALGFNGFTFEEYNANRLRMFGVDSRKVSIAMKDELGRKHAYVNELANLLRYAEGFEESFRRGDYLLEAKPDRGSGNLYVHSHEHLGMEYKPTTIGWMMESLLQQRGIPYVVDNLIYDAVYVYHPERKAIELLSLKSDQCSRF